MTAFAGPTCTEWLSASKPVITIIVIGNVLTFEGTGAEVFTALEASGTKTVVLSCDTAVLILSAETYATR